MVLVAPRPQTRRQVTIESHSRRSKRRRWTPEFPPLGPTPTARRCPVFDAVVQHSAALGVAPDFDAGAVRAESGASRSRHIDIVVENYRVAAVLGAAWPIT
jgi:hypothetical protein